MSTGLWSPTRASFLHTQQSGGIRLVAIDQAAPMQGPQVPGSGQAEHRVDGHAAQAPCLSESDRPRGKSEKHLSIGASGLKPLHGQASPHRTERKRLEKDLGRGLWFMFFGVEREVAAVDWQM
jgi:hypothetical protein